METASQFSFCMADLYICDNILCILCCGSCAVIFLGKDFMGGLTCPSQVGTIDYTAG